jgi:hypothetical protein
MLILSFVSLWAPTVARTEPGECRTVHIADGGLHAQRLFDVLSLRLGWSIGTLTAILLGVPRCF